ncbi:MAG: cell division protein FtsK [Rhodospirillaceae bacterium]|nr:cell division protein FtsK [Rhodospirillaceae bacterium]
MSRTIANSARPALLPPAARDLLKRRCFEVAGLLLFSGSILITLALLSYQPSDWSWNTASDGTVHNLLGAFGAVLSDVILQAVGLASVLMLVALLAWGWRMFKKERVTHLWIRLLMAISGILFTTIFLSLFQQSESWPLSAGLGGAIGMVLEDLLVDFLKEVTPGYEQLVIGGLILPPAAATMFVAIGLNNSEWRALWQPIHKSLHEAWKGALLVSDRTRRRQTRTEPVFEHSDESPEDTEDGAISQEVLEFKSKTSLSASSPRRASTAIVADKAKQAAAGESAKKAQQGKLALGNSYSIQLPPLDFLESPPEIKPEDKADKSALSQNAELLESVLQDFGVKGEIVKVRPGPVVTLYELEPAPGTKTSRVVGLSDDIARSMSALSVRIAVVPGRSVIGIELPNARRDLVYFRELLESRVFEKSNGALTLVLGKDIGGLPVMVDLARMPHLLIAGTTGSGKSVAVNTMICSLLYRLTPDQCKFIMIDPKMLELSVYDGIPNLLSPVVTDPSKAVVALKWAVREMEDRYRLMSQLGVRNITGYNSRLTEARKKGEKLTRTVQTGFDDTGKPIYEDQPLSMDPLPLIVIVVDEMADLMMVAGKDIEAAIQRLAQMARAAGIHLIMATQRPSVDVITGTIKANFPTRISFQVTSKIDSRTILGEQGAEQLLGQGDMLYMAGGGQITRVHGPFVSDEEVEHVVSFLKSQAEPHYITEVTEDVDDGSIPPLQGASGSSDNSYYDEAVALVAREGKASTSFIQRHLQIGYNRAARIMEQMEEQGVVSKADRVGRRKVLVDSH